MDNIIYVLSKFSQEALVLEGFFISLFCLVLFGYYIFKRRRYGVAKEVIPDHVVRAFLVEVLSLTEGFKRQLFGAHGLEGVSLKGLDLSKLASALPTAAASAVSHGNDPALQAQLTALAAKNDELSKLLNQLTTDKNGLEAKLKAANAAAAQAAVSATPAGNGASSAELDASKSRIASLEAKLAEYEVIEDDLANLKRYQQEIKQLKAQIEMSKGGGGSPAPAGESVPAPEPVVAKAEAPAPVAEAAAPVPDLIPEAEAIVASPLAEAEEVRAEPEAKFEDLAPKVEESITTGPAAPAAASVKDPEVVAKAQTAPPAADTPAAPATPEAKADSDLLAEFEKMLNT